MSEWQRTAFAAVAAAFLIGVTPVAHAEYYLIFPEPNISQWIEYKSPSLKKHKKHTVHKQKSKCLVYAKPKHRKPVHRSRSHYSIEVTYVWPICPGCACNSAAGLCHPNDEQLNRQFVGRSYVTFHAEPTRHAGRAPKMEETFDQRTRDDDVMHYPDMNNQY